MQALKDQEDPVEIFWVDADAVVLDRDHPFTVAPLGPDADQGRRLPAVLERVADQILQQLAHAEGVGRHQGQGLTDDRRARFSDGLCHQSQRLVEDLVEIARLQRHLGSSDPGELEKILNHRLHAQCAARRDFDELVRLHVELSRITALQQLHIARDHAQRRLEIVRRDERELFELLV